MALSKKQQKTIEILDRNVQMSREFMNDWLLFNQILSAYPSPGVNKAQLESQFLKIKSKLAREHLVLKEALQSDYRIDQNLMNIISAATNLETIYGQSEVAIKKLQSEWHRAFISINETLGIIEDKKARAEQGEKVWVGVAAGQVKVGISPKTKKYLLPLALAAAIVAVFLAVPQLRDLYWDSVVELFRR